MRRFLLTLFCLATLAAIRPASAQDSLYYRQLVYKLASEEFRGRGYSLRGDSIAAQFLSEEMRRLGLRHWGADYRQPVPIDMNLFEGDAYIHFDTQDSDLVLFDNVEFMAYSKGAKGSFAVKTLKVERLAKALKKPGQRYRDCFVCIDISGLNPKDSVQNALLKVANQTFMNNPLHAKGYIIVSEKLIGWHIGYGQYPREHTTINVVKSCLKKMPKQVDISLDQRFCKKYPSQNLCGYIEGKSCPDSFFVFTGHYDHLGKFGRDYTFYGANDNASGAAFVMDLARHYSLPENRPDYSIAFMLFTGEEVGLVGSFYNSEHPILPLDKIKMLINLDMVGTNEEGITVVCAPDFQEDFDLMTRINGEHNYLKKVAPRKATANSDHYPFYKKGCRTFFIYGMGKSGRYHSKYDTPEAMSFGNQNGLFRLLIDYVSAHKPSPATTSTENR